ncbi:hypothetical protein GCM10009824_16820 [Kocuria atrinae]|uniref:Uncharacterized protein n=1 Tax=Kocuria atrinae TaxID=592377 RepID=A0ABN2XUZ7_9MICC
MGEQREDERDQKDRARNARTPSHQGQRTVAQDHLSSYQDRGRGGMILGLQRPKIVEERNGSKEHQRDTKPNRQWTGAVKTLPHGGGSRWGGDYHPPQSWGK